MKIAVLVPMYNGAKCVANALKSLELQTRKADHIIVVDDCSKDNSAEIIKKFENPNIHYFLNEKNLGMIGNWNQCLKIAQSFNPDIVTFLHQDDGYEPHFLQAIESDFGRNDIGFWACSDFHKDSKSIEINQNLQSGKIVEQGKCISMFGDWDYIPAPTSVCFKMDALSKVGFYNSAYRYVAEPELYLKLTAQGFNFYRSDASLVWRTVPKERASEVLGASSTFLKEWIYFQKNNKQLLKKETHLKRLMVFASVAGGSLAGSLSKFKFLEAARIFKLMVKETSQQNLKSQVEVYIKILTVIFKELFQKANILLRKSAKRIYVILKKNNKEISSSKV